MAALITVVGGGYQFVSGGTTSLLVEVTAGIALVGAIFSVVLRDKAASNT